MGVLQRFERRLEGMVEGTFARVFKSELQPVEVASAVQHEMDERAAIVAQGRTLVPNDFVVEIAQTDAERLDVLAEDLGVELATLARDHAKEQGYSFVGPVRIRFEGVPDLTTGTFRIRSGVIRGHTVEAGEVRQPVSDLPRVASSQFPGRPRLVVSGSSPGTGVAAGSTYELQTPVTLLGRGTDCDLRWSMRGYRGTIPSCGWRTARWCSSISGPPTARSSTGNRCAGWRWSTAPRSRSAGPR